MTWVAARAGRGVGWSSRGCDERAANNVQTAKPCVPVVVLMRLSVAFTGLVRLMGRRRAHWKGVE